MKVNLNQKVKNFDGEVLKKPVKKGKEINEVDFTLAVAFIDALTADFKSEVDLSGAKKLERYILAQKVNRKKSAACDFTVEEIVLIKEVVGKAFGTLIVGYIYEILK